jgi:2,4-dienoyl-CoA reductase-like NADH-dependent reductase (Old Yellow Enzyme family)
MSLFEPLTLRGVTLRNRIMMSPMSQRAALEDGRAGDWHLVHYGSRAVGGCGLVMIEDTAVAPLGRTSGSALGLYDHPQALALERIVGFCHSQGAAVGVQLAHAGRKALADRRGEAGTLAASPVTFGPGWVQPRAASAEDLAGVVDGFARAALMAAEAGFDVVEVHAAHGYLLHQFLSPLTNLREDGYGGDAANRRRLLLEVVRAVRDRWPSQRSLFVRLPAGDGQAGGLGIEEVADCARACLAAGADLVDLSGGTPLLGGDRAGPRDVLELARELAREPAARTRDQAGSAQGQAGRIREPAGSVQDQAGRIREPAGSAQVQEGRDAVRDGSSTAGWPSSPPVALGGGIVDGASAEALLEEGGASLASVGRPLLGDPYWPVRAALELGVQAPLPSAYAEALADREGVPALPFGRAVSSPDHSKHFDGCTKM